MSGVSIQGTWSDHVVSAVVGGSSSEDGTDAEETLPPDGSLQEGENTHTTFFIGFFLLWTFLILMWCRMGRRHQAQRRREAEERRLRRFVEEDHSSTEDERVKERFKRICSKLIVKEWDEKAQEPVEIRELQIVDSDDNGGADQSEKQLTVDEPDLEKGKPSTSEEESSRSLTTLRNDECAICLERFENKQLVCQANNSLCVHVFHQECMLEWLRIHDNCPVCRMDFLKETS